jgi:hypothetical protein
MRRKNKNDFQSQWKIEHNFFFTNPEWEWTRMFNDNDAKNVQTEYEKKLKKDTC